MERTWGSETDLPSESESNPSPWSTKPLCVMTVGSIATQNSSVSERARKAQQVGKLRSDLGPKPRGPGRGRGTGRARGPPAQSRLLVARLLNCVRVIVVLEAVHSD